MHSNDFTSTDGDARVVRAAKRVATELCEHAEPVVERRREDGELVAEKVGERITEVTPHVRSVAESLDLVYEQVDTVVLPDVTGRYPWDVDDAMEQPDDMGEMYDRIGHEDAVLEVRVRGPSIEVVRDDEVVEAFSAWDVDDVDFESLYEEHASRRPASGDSDD